MKKIAFLLFAFILLYFFISCDGGDDNSHEVAEQIAPEVLTDVDICFYIEGEIGIYRLTLNDDGSASLNWRISLHFYSIDYGSYTYEREDIDIGILSVSYAYTERYADDQLIDTQSIDMSVEYILYFDDEVSGSLNKISEEDSEKEGPFTIENYRN